MTAAARIAEARRRRLLRERVVAGMAGPLTTEELIDTAPLILCESWKVTLRQIRTRPTVRT
jgi:hypothetical protein